MSRKVNNNGRSKGGDRYVVLSHPILISQAWLDLPPPACKILIDMRRRFNGYNNGDITLSVREAAIAGNCGKSSAQRHLESLIRHGFIALNIKGKMRNRNASTWFLTTENSDHDPSYPTNAWKCYQPSEIPATMPRLKLCM